MSPARLLAAPLILSVVLVGAAGCGSSASKPNNAAACQKLQADVNPLSNLGSTSNLTQLQSTIGSVSSKLKTDAKQGDSALQSSVNQLTTNLNKLLSDAKAKNVSAVKTDLAGLETDASQINKVCPDSSSSS